MNPVLSHVLAASAGAFGSTAGLVLALRWAARKVAESEAAENPYMGAFCNEHGPTYEVLPTAGGHLQETSPFGPVNLWGLKPPSCEDVLFEDIREVYEARQALELDFPSTTSLMSAFGISESRAAELKRRFDREFGGDSE